MPTPSPCKVLVVDDDLGLLQLVNKSLSREGFAVTLASSGREAVSQLDSHPIDLILLDLKLPDIQGPDLLRRLNAGGRQIPFIIITGQGDERVAVEMMKTGALDYLVKDVQFMELVPTVVRRAMTQIEKERRLALAEKQARLTMTVVQQSYSAVIIFSHDRQNPAIHYVNPAFLTLTGCTAASLIGNSLIDLEAVTGSWEPFRKVLDSGKSFVGEMKIHSRQGAQLVVDCTITWVLDQAGSHTHFVIIMRDITERHQLEREILEISDREQARIGRDLHDGLGQQLTALEFFVTGLKDEVIVQAPGLLQPMEEISLRLREAIRQARGMANGLSPVSLHGDGLGSALQKLAENTRTLARVDCRFIHTESTREMLDTGLANQLFRIAQEGVNNALKHGRPKSISISLTTATDHICLLISDDGRGFDPSSIKEAGMGLRAMKYRADLIGASLTVESAPGKGTRINCHIQRKL